MVKSVSKTHNKTRRGLYVEAVPTADEIDKMTTDQMLAILPKLRATATATLWATARIWMRLDAAGVDLDPYRDHLSDLYPAIASGTADIEAVQKFSKNRVVLKKVMELPVTQQRKLAANKPVVVLSRKGDTYTEKAKPAWELTATEARSAIRDGRLRTVEEQKASMPKYVAKLGTTRPSVPSAEAKPRWGRVTVDTKAGLIRVGGSVAPIADTIAALKAAKCL